MRRSKTTFPFMKTNSIKNICLGLLALLIIFSPLKTANALSPYWVDVPESRYGKQFWDKNSFQKNKDGSIRVLSKFIPKSNTKITQDILYTMDINCSKKSFKDVAIGVNEFNEFNNKDSEWQEPNGDRLIIGVIDQVCIFSDQITSRIK